MRSAYPYLLDNDSMRGLLVLATESVPPERLGRFTQGFRPREANIAQLVIAQLRELPARTCAPSQEANAVATHFPMARSRRPASAFPQRLPRTADAPHGAAVADASAAATDTVPLSLCALRPLRCSRDRPVAEFCTRRMTLARAAQKDRFDQSDGCDGDSSAYTFTASRAIRCPPRGASR